MKIDFGTVQYQPKIFVSGGREFDSRQVAAAPPVQDGPDRDAGVQRDAVLHRLGALQ